MLRFLGSLINAFAQNAFTFAAGCFVWQIGFTSSFMVMEVILADVTSLRSRLFFSYIPSLPFLVGAWISGDLIEVMLRTRDWRFGFWIWAVLYPLSIAPLVCTLWWVERKAKKSGTHQHFRTPVQEHGIWGVTQALFWQLDVVGMFLTMIIFGCLLVPLTINGWIWPIWNTPKFIVPMVVGVLLIPAWIKWESLAPYPTIPFHVRHLFPM